MLIFPLALLAAAIEKPFPEQVPVLMEACLGEAIDAGRVRDTEESHKYICAGEAADKLWAFLERHKVQSYEQDTPEGKWLSREFPLGGCFKRVRMPDGGPLVEGLSCTIWVPRLKGKAESEVQ
ncbi:MAG TPA: hypothetical protein QF469_03300 [Sphingomonas sanguinis]|uniref:Uncharacterized protein n=2 Tax=Sphingomonas sanguinis TaxID=33051 RepID=A0A147HZB0_9SPHN|nr:hypothetical protein [Sphingomonas sanguinis]KTT70360.1 hypothetical protein NS319_07785 [Sphingomonas sanguinis]HJO64344.1 hypothetical protein [Sphingomonas sanguinis]